MQSDSENVERSLVIDEHRVVLMHYRLCDGFGRVIDSSLGGLPMTYMHNSGALLPSLERELTGHFAGDNLELAIYPEDGYGYRDESLVSQVPRAAFADMGELHVGMRVRGHKESGAEADAATAKLMTVLEIGEDLVSVDANHPLAGQVLHFHIAVVNVREPTEAELAENLGPGVNLSPPWLDE